jgi:hypothetical protein
VDGVTSLDATQLETNLRNALANRKTVSPGAIVEIFDFQVNQNAITGRVRVEALENLTNVTLQIALIEREINICPPPGINGQTYFFDVFRVFYPSADGTALTLAAGEKQFVTFTIQPDQQWVLDQMQVVAFVQKQNQEIVQAAWTLYP